MTATPTIPMRSDTAAPHSPAPAALDLNEAADAMARLFDLADEIRALPPERRPARISAFLAYTGHLAGLLAGTHDDETHVELADRLWMVCASPLELRDLAVATAASWAEKLITDQDARGIAAAGARVLVAGATADEEGVGMTAPDVTAVPEIVRSQIAGLFLQVRDLRENLIDVIEIYRRFDQRLADAGAPVDGGTFLCDLTGLTAVMDLLGDIAERCTTGIGGTTGGLQGNFDSAEVIEFMWPSTAWPMADAEARAAESDAASEEEVTALTDRASADGAEDVAVIAAAISAALDRAVARASQSMTERLASLEKIVGEHFNDDGDIFCRSLTVERTDAEARVDLRVSADGCAEVIARSSDGSVRIFATDEMSPSATGLMFVRDGNDTATVTEDEAQVLVRLADEISTRRPRSEAAEALGTDVLARLPPTAGPRSLRTLTRPEDPSPAEALLRSRLP